VKKLCCVLLWVVAVVGVRADGSPPLVPGYGWLYFQDPFEVLDVEDYPSGQALYASQGQNVGPVWLCCPAGSVTFKQIGMSPVTFSIVGGMYYVVLGGYGTPYSLVPALVPAGPVPLMQWATCGVGLGVSVGLLSLLGPVMRRGLFVSRWGGGGHD
jgi:hypothetical protein